MITVTFDSLNYTAREGSANPVEVCVRATGSRIKSQQQLNVMVVITPVMSGTSLLHINRGSQNAIILIPDAI